MRKALEREPNNSEYMLDLADVFARMSCYDESNRILVSIVRMGEATPECFFGMGCNFYALRQYDRAREAFLTYQQLDPDGEFLAAVEDMLDELDEWEEAMEASPLKRVSAMAQRGGRALDEGDYHLAVRLLSRAVKREPELSYVRNNLALALFCLGNVDQAAKETARVLSLEPDNLHANCNMAIILDDRGRRGQAAVHLKRAVDAAQDDVDDLSKICLTLCEMGRDEDAYAYLKRLLHLKPYDKLSLHHFGIACYNLAEYREAIAAWDRVRRIDPYSPVPPYCIARARAAIEGEAPSRMTYSDQLPAEEVRRRVAEFAGNLSGGREEFTRRFEEDASFRDLVRWGLGVADVTFRRTALKLLTFMGGDRAEEMLREFLMRPDEGEESKREIMAALKEIGAPEPYIAVMGGAVVEVRISVFNSDRPLTDTQRIVVQMAIEALPLAQESPRDVREHAVKGIIALWIRFLDRAGSRGARIRKPQNWAAALVFMYCAQEGIDLDRRALCRRLDVPPRSLKTYEAYFTQALSDGEKTDDD